MPEKPEGARILFDALFQVEEQAGKNIHTAPCGIVHDDRTACDTAQLANQIRPARAVGQEPDAHDVIKGAVRERQCQHRSGDKAQTAVVHLLLDSRAAGLVAAVYRHIKTGVHQRDGELRVTAAHIQHGSTRRGGQPIQHDPALEIQHPFSNRTRKAAGIVGRGGLDIRRHFLGVDFHAHFPWRSYLGRLVWDKRYFAAACCGLPRSAYSITD